MGTLLRLLAKPTIQRIARASLTLGGNFHRDLVGGSADTATLHLKAGTGIVHCLLEDIKGINSLGTVTGALDGGVDDALGDRTLSTAHDGGDETGNQGAAVAEVALDFLGDDAFAAGHGKNG